jgi:hypothetical protein
MQYRQQASTKPRILSSPQRWRPPQTANTRELGSSRGKRLADEGGVALGEVTADRSSSTSAPTGTTARRSASRTSAVHSLPHRYGRCTSASAAHSMLECGSAQPCRADASGTSPGRAAIRATTSHSWGVILSATGTITVAAVVRIVVRNALKPCLKKGVVRR